MSLCYKTRLEEAHCGDSFELIETLENDSVDLVVTSPPFVLLRQKEYNNKNQEAYNNGEPTYSLYQFRTLIKLWIFLVAVIQQVLQLKN